MRDGMPGPGWWIASDGRWYPPELHPDVRASTAVTLAEPATTAPPAAVPPATFDGVHSLPEASAARVTTPPTSNGSGVATGVATGVSSSVATGVATREVLREVPKQAAARAPGEAAPARPLSRRSVPGIALALGSLAVIIYLAHGHDVRPSLSGGTVTTAVSGVAVPAPPLAPATTDTTSAQRTAASTAPGAAATAPSVTTAGGATATTTSRPGTTQAPTTTAAARVTPHVVSVFDLVKGNCLDSPDLTDGLVTTIRVVDCSESHTHEVYYSGRYPDSTYDASKISSYANDTCLAQFAPYVGIDYSRSRYEYLHIVPTQDSWTRDNDRDIVCVAFEEDKTITGSIAGRAQ